MHFLFQRGDLGNVLLLRRRKRRTALDGFESNRVRALFDRVRQDIVSGYFCAHLLNAKRIQRRNVWILFFSKDHRTDDARKEPLRIPIDVLNSIKVDIAAHFQIFGLRVSDDGHGLLRRILLKFFGDVMNQNMRLMDGLASHDMRTKIAMLLQDVYAFLILQSVGLFFYVVFFRRNQNAIVFFQEQAEIFRSVGIPSGRIMQN